MADRHIPPPVEAPDPATMPPPGPYTPALISEGDLAILQHDLKEARAELERTREMLKATAASLMCRVGLALCSRYDDACGCRACLSYRDALRILAAAAETR